MIKHIAIIPDGNRRWAKKNNKSLYEAYKVGIEKIKDVLKWCKKNDIKILTMWGFSTENYNRNGGEKEILFELFSLYLDEVIKKIKEEEKKVKEKTKFNFFGNFELFPEKIQEQIKSINKNFNGYDEGYYVLNILLGYGGRQEILKAVNELLEEGKKNVDEKEFQMHLYTKNMPDPDLVIRTSGEKRLSGLMPWQTVYSEFMFIDKLWPEFSEEDFNKVLEEYKRRKRRFGK